MDVLTTAITACTLSSTCSPKTTFTTLPQEILDRIASHALTLAHTKLDPLTFRPLASSLRVQLVCRLFTASVKEALYRTSGLQIHIFNPALHALLHHEPCADGTHATLQDINATIQRHRDTHELRMQNLNRVPVHRFRKIEVHLIPQLAAINVASDVDLERFFPETLDALVDDADRVGHDDVWKAMKACLLRDASAVGLNLKSRLSPPPFCRGHTDVKLWCHNGVESLPEYDFGMRERFQVNQLPGAWGMYLSRDLGEVFPVPRIPNWLVEDMLVLMDSFRWLHHRVPGGCYAKSLFESVRLPSLMCMARSDGNAVQRHAMLRQRLISLWKGEVEGSQRELKDVRSPLHSLLKDDEADDKYASLFLTSLHRRMISASRLRCDKVIPECGRCEYCSSNEHLWNRLSTECDDAFEVAGGDSPNLHAWPKPYALHHEALFLRLADLQVEKLMRVHRKNGQGLRKVQQWINAWVGITDACVFIFSRTVSQRPFSNSYWRQWIASLILERLDIPILNQWDIPPQDRVSYTQTVEEQLWLFIDRLPGYCDKGELLDRLGWCRSRRRCTHSNHWGQGTNIFEADSRSLHRLPIHPAFLALAFSRTNLQG
jgi:hypothetical protein